MAVTNIPKKPKQIDEVYIIPLRSTRKFDRRTKKHGSRTVLMIPRSGLQSDEIYVPPYYRKNGQFVHGHHKSRPYSKQPEILDLDKREHQRKKRHYYNKYRRPSLASAKRDKEKQKQKRKQPRKRGRKRKVRKSR